MGYEPPYGYESTGGEGERERPAPSYGSGEYPPPPQYPYTPFPPPPPPYPAQAAPGMPQGEYPPPPYMQTYYAQPYGVPMPYPVAAPPDPGGGMAIASLVLGIISLVFALLFFCGGFFAAPVTGIIGLILGILGRKSQQHHGMAIAGIVMSIIAIVVSVGIFALYIGLFFLTPTTNY